METEERRGDSMTKRGPVRGESCMASPRRVPVACGLSGMSCGSECWQKLPAVTASLQYSRWGTWCPHVGS